MKIWSDLKLTEVKFEKDLAEGVHYAEKSYVNDLGKNVDAYVITVSAEARARMAAWAAPWCTTKHIVDQCREMKDAGKEVLFACNAGYFHLSAGTLDPYGIQIVEGKVNQEPSKDDLVHSDNWFGCTYDGQEVIGNCDDYFANYKGKLRDAVGGGWITMRNGKHTNYHDHGVDPYPVVGIAPDGSFAIICTDGRSSKSAGASCYDMTLLLEELNMGITDAMIFDGGGSVAVYIKDGDDFSLRNIPSGPPKDPEKWGELRPVADIRAIVVDK